MNQGFLNRVVMFSSSSMSQLQITAGSVATIFTILIMKFSEQLAVVYFLGATRILATMCNMQRRKVSYCVSLLSDCSRPLYGKLSTASVLLLTSSGSFMPTSTEQDSRIAEFMVLLANSTEYDNNGSACKHFVVYIWNFLFLFN